VLRLDRHGSTHDLYYTATQAFALRLYGFFRGSSRCEAVGYAPVVMIEFTIE
jgi:hypothetical protein